MLESCHGRVSGRNWPPSSCLGIEPGPVAPVRIDSPYPSESTPDDHFPASPHCRVLSARRRGFLARQHGPGILSHAVSGAISITNSQAFPAKHEEFGPGPNRGIPPATAQIVGSRRQLSPVFGLLGRGAVTPPLIAQWRFGLHCHLGLWFLCQRVGQPAQSQGKDQ